MAIEEVTPSVYPSGALFPYEERTLELLGKEHFSVVNVFDVILHHQLNIMGVVEVPEGNEGVHNFKGKLICADSAEDLAVLKVEDTDDLLRPINVGQSSSLRVDQQCLAIGIHLVFDRTLTVGLLLDKIKTYLVKLGSQLVVEFRCSHQSWKQWRSSVGFQGKFNWN
ncbi:hypothetical protein CsSME_00042345 [Camellia sinensis var. sinensis]